MSFFQLGRSDIRHIFSSILTHKYCTPAVPSDVASCVAAILEASLDIFDEININLSRSRLDGMLGIRQLKHVFQVVFSECGPRLWA